MDSILIDILDFFFSYIKTTDKLSEDEKYSLLPIICKYIAIFNEIHEDVVELALMTSDVGNLRLAPSALMPASRHPYDPSLTRAGKYDSKQRAQAIAIKYMDNENRQLLLTRLNEISQLQQLHDKVIEIEEGDVLVNAVGEIIKS